MKLRGLFPVVACAVLAWAGAARGAAQLAAGRAGPTSTAPVAELAAPANAPVGGIIPYALSVGAAGWQYVLEASLTGTTPGIVIPGFLGATLPLNPPLLNTTYGASASGAFQGFTGVADPAGHAVAAIAVPQDPALAGITVFAAFVAFDPILPRAAVSGPVATTITASATLTISAITPPVAAAGAIVTVHGTGFAPGLVASISGFPVAATLITQGSFQFTMPPGTFCDAPVVASLPDGQQAYRQFSPGPAIVSVSGSPASAAGGGVVTIAGLDFHAGTTVAIGGAPAQVTAMTTTAITAIAPPGPPGTTALSVTSVAGCPASFPFAYQ